MAAKSYNVDWLRDLPAALRFCRAARRLSLAQVADRTGVAIPTIHRIETGKRDGMTVETLITIANWVAGLSETRDAHHIQSEDVEEVLQTMEYLRPKSSKSDQT